MAKIQLTGIKRDALKAFAREVVTTPVEAEAERAAYEAAAPLVRALVEERFPPADMEVCRKYDVAAIDCCIRILLTAGGVEQFDFHRDTGPLVVDRRYCQSRMYQADDATTDAVTAWVRARDKHKEVRAQKLRDYSALIDTSRYFEDVTAVWTEAEALRPRFQTSVPATLSEDVIARIRADQAERTAA